MTSTEVDEVADLFGPLSWEDAREWAAGFLGDTPVRGRGRRPAKDWATVLDVCFAYYFGGESVRTLARSYFPGAHKQSDRRRNVGRYVRIGEGLVAQMRMDLRAHEGPEFEQWFYDELTGSAIRAALKRIQDRPDRLERSVLSARWECFKERFDLA